MRPATALSILLIAAALGCSNVRTQYDFDPAADFSGWRTYAWYPAAPAPTGNPRADSPLLRTRIEGSIDRALAERGFSRASGGEPDFYVFTHLSTEQRLDVRQMNHMYMGGPHRRGWGGMGWGGVGWAETHVQQYEEGTLVIDFVDVPARRLVWRGSGSRRLLRSPRREQLDRRVDETVDETLSGFPPR